MLDRAEAAQILEIVDVDVPVIDLIATLAQEVADHAGRRHNSPKLPIISVRSRRS